MTTQFNAELKLRNLRRSVRKVKNFLVFYGKKQFQGHDVSLQGISFYFDPAEPITLLRGQKVSLTVAFVNHDDQFFKYDLTATVTHLTELGTKESVFGCEIIEVKEPLSHIELLEASGTNFPTDELLMSAPVKPLSKLVANANGAPSSSYVDHKGEYAALLEISKLIHLINKQSVDEQMDCDEFRELVLKVTGDILSKEILKPIK